MKPQKWKNKQPFYCSQWKSIILTTQERFLLHQNIYMTALAMTYLSRADGECETTGYIVDGLHRYECRAGCL